MDRIAAENSLIAGMIPPQAKELENAVLGAIMLEDKCFEEISEILPVGSFYVDAHNTIYQAMANLGSRNMPIDLLTVCEELNRCEKLQEVGGYFYVTSLTKGVVSTAHTSIHARIVLEKFILREAIKIANETISVAYRGEEDVFDFLDDFEAKVFALTTNYLSTEYKHISEGIAEVTDRIEYLKGIDSDITGVPSGYSLLDSVTHGWQPSDLIILAARPSVGKTAFALNLARNASLHSETPCPVGFFSLEMSIDQLTKRMLARESNVWLKSINRGKMTPAQESIFYNKGVNRLHQASIYIDDTAGISLHELRAKARRMVKKHGVKLIIVDYLQLMNGDRNDRRVNNREQEISKISRGLKGIAKSLNVPVIALSQLSREVEKRGDNRPRLSDLRESGAIEQDADIVAFPYRPTKDERAKDPALETLAFLEIAKHRNGELREFVFRIDNSVQLWEEHSDMDSFDRNSLNDDEQAIVF